MSNSHKKRHFTELNNVSNGSQSIQPKKRKIMDCNDDNAVIEFLNLNDNVLSDDIIYFIQKDYNIEARFLEPRFLELSKENASKLIRQSPIDIDGDEVNIEIYCGKLPLRERERERKGASPSSGYTVWIGNITKKASRQHLVKRLRDFGEILNVYVLSQNKNAYNCAFVDFASPFDVVSIGRAVYHRKLKISDVPIAVVLRKKTIDKLFEYGYTKQLTQMIDYGMLNTKHAQYYKQMRYKYKYKYKYELEDGEIIDNETQNDNVITYATKSYRSLMKECDAQICCTKQGIIKQKEKRENMEKDLMILQSNESITERIKCIQDNNERIKCLINECKTQITKNNNDYDLTVDNLHKQRLRLYSMKQQFASFCKNYDSVLGQWDERRHRWELQESAAKEENNNLLCHFSNITQSVSDETDVFEALDVEQKAMNARYSVLHHKVELKKKEIEEALQDHNCGYAAMEGEYNKLKVELHSEQKQHENTHNVLAQTVAKVKESIKSINHRQRQKDIIVERLQKRLQLYKHHLKQYVMIQQTRNSNSKLIV